MAYIARCTACVSSLWTAIAFGAPPPISIPTEQQALESAQPGGFFEGLSRRSFLLGDLWGLRPFLAERGMSLAIQETSELLGNTTGGVQKGFVYDGVTTVDLQLDTQRAFGFHGGTFNASVLQVHGSNLSAQNLYTLQTASGIEADNGLRLWELWYEQRFSDEDRLDVKVGQQSLDQEFMVSDNALLFVNTMFGWAMVPSADLPGGGPAYPLSALGVRVHARPTQSLTVLAGVFNGSPVSGDSGDPQKQNPHGVSFPLNGGALAIAELQYAYPSLGAMVYPGESEPLARVYKVGVWYDSESFADLRYDQNGRSLADPASNGVAQGHRGNYGLYAVADQMIWRSQEEADRTLNFFARAMGAPQQDRNLISYSLNAGFTLHEPIRHRDDDTFGAGLGYAKVGDGAAGLDHDSGLYGGSYFPVRNGETFVEVTYQIQVAPWLQVQPDFQYVFNPGAGVLDPSSGGQTVRNEAVLGVRLNISL